MSLCVWTSSGRTSSWARLRGSGPTTARKISTGSNVMSWCRMPFRPSPPMSWTPRVGDTVLIGFYMNDRPIILGTLPPKGQKPVCRSSANPLNDLQGSYEDWTNDDYKNYYDYRFRLDQWLNIPRRSIKDLDGKAWPTTFDHDQVVVAGKLRPVCFNYFDKTRDVMAVFECKKGKDVPDCKLCELNGDGTGDGPDNVTCCNEPLSGTLPAMNTWLKILSSDYEGTADLPRRFKLHWSCGSLFCSDSKCGNDTEGRIWLEAQKAHVARAHIHFRAQGAQTGANLSLRSDLTKAAHIELFGVGDALKGRILCENADIGNYVDIEATDQITIHAAKIVLDGDVEITGNNKIDGACAHGACSCMGGGAGGTSGTCTGTGAANQAIAHGMTDNLGTACSPSSVAGACRGGGSCTITGCDDTNFYATITAGEIVDWSCGAPKDGWGDWAPCF
jgi:hypothetical protein